MFESVVCGILAQMTQIITNSIAEVFCKQTKTGISALTLSKKKKKNPTIWVDRIFHPVFKISRVGNLLHVTLTLM